MEKKMYYNRLEKVVMTWKTSEVQDALMKREAIPNYDPKRKRIEFEMNEDGAEMILTFEEEEILRTARPMVEIKESIGLKEVAND